MLASKFWWVAMTVLAVPAAHATDGYFQHGYGIEAQSMGGAATAVADNAMGGANNPASMLFAGNRLDAGLVAFSPRRRASRDSAFPGPVGAAASGRNYFPVPSFGWNHVVDGRYALGVTVYGNGGMNTDYPGHALAANTCGAGAPASNLLCGQGHLGVNLQQLVVAPTFALRLTEHQALGFSPLFAYQRFEAYGLQAFAGMSVAPDHLTNRGTSSSTGVGVRVGWYAQVGNHVTLGAAYSPRLHMSRFDDYRGLFAGHGSFDLPENWNVGVALRPNGRWLIAADYQRINYGDVPSVGRTSRVQAPLGSPAGPGFGWRNTNVWKLGVAWRVDDRWTLRAGYNHSTNPVTAANVTFNILAPGVIRDHATLGLAYRTAGGELSLSYLHAFSNRVRGVSLIDPMASETLRMHEDSIGIGYGWRL
ncbi:MAG: long-chain fatty acid transporter [Rhodanobacter sp.]|nr:MAG: long-chain fatty acid transporter [Rhodanobacter sp.]TAM14695.1 MAG: long-chain fatty acid transporter [Rhodanobacter sp.]TAM37489.1 MAG: long-chain fatty acid transporter [Rhodanobacter sp.]